MSVCGPALFSVVSRPGHHRVDMIFNGGGVKIFFPDQEKNSGSRNFFSGSKKNSV